MANVTVNLATGQVETDPNFLAPSFPIADGPRSLHIAWIKAALVDLGKADAVDALVAQMDPIKRTLWEYSTSISEADPDVNLVAQAVGIDLASLFNRAGELKAARGL